ncbi:alpha/beta hydrolase [Streptomyces diacarni]|uniref:alpha/beta fold hydrolase n=1 Tax=Streptomyces diacarni TaxID=2800381 RepID=UPI0033EEB8D0
MPEQAPPATHWSTTRFADNDEVRLAYDTFEDATEGAPLLLIMGLGVARHWWPTGLCQAFADAGFAVARYDQRDAGDSSRIPDTAPSNPLRSLLCARPAPYTAEDMTDDAVAVLDALSWDRAHVFGHSLGGLLAQRLALRHPGRVASVTTSAALPSDVAGLRVLRYLRPGLLTRLARARFPEGREGDIEASVAVWRGVSSPGYPFDEAAARAWAEAQADTGPRDTKAQSRQIGAPWHGPALRTLGHPTLVLHGQEDPILRVAAARATARTVPDSRLVTYPGVGHDLPAALWPDVARRVATLATSTTLRPTRP